jgi:hypothetical protein
LIVLLLGNRLAAEKTRAAVLLTFKNEQPAVSSLIHPIGDIVQAVTKAAAGAAVHREGDSPQVVFRVHWSACGRAGREPLWGQRSLTGQRVPTNDHWNEV